MKDEVVRALTEDRNVRVVVVSAADVIAQIDAIHQVGPQDRARLAELVLATVLLREAMARNNRLQVTLRSDDGSLFADSFPGGMTRGMAGGGVVGGNLSLHVARVSPDGAYSEGMVEVRSPDISEGVGEYVRVSEQVETVIKVYAEFDDEGVKTAIGVLAQLLPGGTTEDLLEVESRVSEDWKTLTADGFARQLAVGGMMLSHDPVYFGCTCSEERVLSALLSMGREEIEDVISKKEVLEVGCEYCGENYSIQPDHLKPLLGPKN